MLIVECNLCYKLKNLFFIFGTNSVFWWEDLILGVSPNVWDGISCWKTACDDDTMAGVIWSVCKVLGQISRVIWRKTDIKILGRVSVLVWVAKITWNNKYFNCVIFELELTYIYIQVVNLCVFTFLLFIKSEMTRKSKIILKVGDLMQRDFRWCIITPCEWCRWVLPRLCLVCELDFMSNLYWRCDVNMTGCLLATKCLLVCFDLRVLLLF